jgi:hypothetical protein
MIGLGGLLLLVPMYSSSYSFIGGAAKKKTAKLRHLILLSRVTYTNIVVNGFFFFGVVFSAGMCA